MKKFFWCMMVGAALVLHFNTGIWSQDAKDGKKVEPPKIEPPKIEVKQDEVKKEDAKKEEPKKEETKVEVKKEEEKKAEAKKEEAKKEEAKKDDGKKDEPKKEEPKAEVKGNPTGDGNADTSFADDDLKKAAGKVKTKDGKWEDADPTVKELATGISKLIDALGGVRAATNMFWTLVTGFLVMFMQAGFALVETGLCRSKSVAHTMAMNFMIYGLGMLGFYICGFAFMFGGSAIGNWGGSTEILTDMYKYKVATPTGDQEWGVIGLTGFFLTGKAFDASVMCLFLFQMVFMDTTCTIPTGAMAERWKYIAFVIFGFCISTFIYPVYGCWVWGGGWLSQLGVFKELGHGHVDFAGSSVVHMTGGVCSLVGAWMIGPRIGKYGKDGSVHVLPAHSVPMYMLGTFILAFAWFGFNPGSSLAATDMNIARCAVTTMLCSAAGAFSSMTYMWLVFGKPDPSFMCNGMLAGLVAITAPCAFVSPTVAVLIGVISGVLVIWSCLFFERIAKIDDPVGAISVHGVNGAWGILCVGLFADGTYGKPWNGVWMYKNKITGAYYHLTEALDPAKLPDALKGIDPANVDAVGVTGLFYGNTGQLTASLIGIAVNVLYVGLASLVMFKVIDLVVGLRSKPEDEIAGLDIPEMGVLGYINDDPKTPEGHLYSAGMDPKSARMPPDGKKRFTVVVEGLPPDKIAAIWSDLCQPTKKPSPDFLAVYPKMTLLTGNKFRFIDGNPEQISAHLARVLQSSANGGSVKTIVEK